MLVRSFVALLISGASCGSVSLCSLRHTRTHTRNLFFFVGLRKRLKASSKTFAVAGHRSEHKRRNIWLHEG